MWADAHPPACIPAKEGKSLLELLLAPSPFHPHPWLVVMVQSRLSQPQRRGCNKISQVWLGRRTLLWCLPWQHGCMSQPAGHVGRVMQPLFCHGWKVREPPLESYMYILGGQGLWSAVQKLSLPLPGCPAVNTLQSWRAKHVGAESSWKTWSWVWGAPENLPPSSYVNLAPRASLKLIEIQGQSSH